MNRFLVGTGAKNPYDNDEEDFLKYNGMIQILQLQFASSDMWHYGMVTILSFFIHTQIKKHFQGR